MTVPMNNGGSSPVSWQDLFTALDRIVQPINTVVAGLKEQMDHHEDWHRKIVAQATRDGRTSRLAVVAIVVSALGVIAASLGAVATIWALSAGR